MSDQTIMIGITAALALLGVGALFMALFWPRRWRLKYRIEVGFVVLLAGLAVYADTNSAQTYGAYEADLVTRFLPQVGIALRNLRRTESLETGMLEAEKKHVLATIARGVSHDVNNAFGSVLPLVQQP